MSGPPAQAAAASGQDEVIAFLSMPAAYGDDAPEITRIDTHASIVFLAGDRAYKLKRAVRYPFLDYSTLTLRQRFCEREVAINRRTAPSLYDGVAAVVRRADGTLAIDGAGTPLDYLVVMRRFAQSNLFSNLAAAGALNAGLMTGAIDQVIALHETAEVALPDAAIGGAAAGLHRVITDDAGELTDFADLFDAPAVDAYAAAAEQSFAAVAGLLDRRATAGFVRHCHGDLHLANIVLFDGQPTLFDAIEFSDSLTRIDTLYDLAFLLMDLDVRGLNELSNRAFNRYLARTGDVMATIEGLAALPLFMSVRAAIRAIVSALTLAKAGASDRAAVRAQALAYFAAAQRYLADQPPTLIALGGPSGTGKSALALALAPAIGAAPGALVLRTDEIRKQLAGLRDDERLPPSAYTPSHHAKVYGEMRARAAASLAAGRSCILDAVHGRPDERRAAQEVAQQHGAPFVGIWLEAPEDCLIERVAARRGDASDAGAEVVRRQLAQGFGAIDWPRIAADRPLAEVTASARALVTS